MLTKMRKNIVGVHTHTHTHTHTILSRNKLGKSFCACRTNNMLYNKELVVH